MYGITYIPGLIGDHEGATPETAVDHDYLVLSHTVTCFGINDVRNCGILLK